MTEAEHDPFDLVGQERAKANIAEEERLQREKDQGDLRHVMGSKEGRRFMWRQLSEAGVYRSSFDSNPVLMAFNEGNRNRGLLLLNDIMEACPTRYSEMLREQKEARERHEQRTADRNRNA